MHFKADRLILLDRDQSDDFLWSTLDRTPSPTDSRETHGMKLIATPVTAAAAGVFSAVSWPLLWPLLDDTTSSSSVWLVVGTLLLIALPAHAFVVGFTRSEPARAGRLDTDLLKRIGAWLLAAAGTIAVVTLFGSS